MVFGSSSSDNGYLSESGSSDSSSSHVDISHDGSRKRRRIENPVKKVQEPAKQPQLFPESSISRIKPKSVNSSKPQNASSNNNENSQEKADFLSLGVDPWLVSALSVMAIKKPTAIQRGCIPHILQEKNVIGGSRTGSGKTIAFAAPIIQKWARDPFGVYAIVLTPTRELALQIYEQIKAVSAPQSMKIALITGGGDMREQAINLTRRPALIVATPGRLADHIRTSGEDVTSGFRRVSFVVFDEADRLLHSSAKGSMLPDIETCLSVLPPSDQRQTLLFSATVTPEVRALKETARPGRPVHVCEIDTQELAVPDTLRQHYLMVPVTHREPYLHTLLTTQDNVTKSTIIFVNRTSTATLLEHMLRMLEHRVTSLHAGLPNSERISNLSRFRAKAARILIATDVASRGLDIPSVAFVVNYDVPHDPDDYVHRVGRTARAGRSGTSVTFVGQRDVDLILAIEARVGAKMTEYEEEGVSIEGRVVRDALKAVGEKKREAMLQIEEGRNVKGKRKKGMAKRSRT